MSLQPRHENKSCSAFPEDHLEPFEFLNFEFKFLNFEFLIFDFFLKQKKGSQLLTFSHFFTTAAAAPLPVSGPIIELVPS